MNIIRYLNLITRASPSNSSCCSDLSPGGAVMLYFSMSFSSRIVGVVKEGYVSKNASTNAGSVS